MPTLANRRKHRDDELMRASPSQGQAKHVVRWAGNVLCGEGAVLFGVVHMIPRR